MPISLGVSLKIGSGALVSAAASVLDSADVYLRGSDWDGVSANVTSGVGSRVFSVADVTLVDGGFDASGAAPALISADTDLLALNTGETATIAYRYRPVVEGGGGPRVLAAQNGGAADSTLGLAVRRRNGAGGHDAQFGNGTSGVNTADIQITLDTYSAVFLIVDTADVVFRVNSTEASSVRPSGDLTPGVALHLFRRSDDPSLYDSGRISDIAIWNRALTPEERSDLVGEWAQ